MKLPGALGGGGLPGLPGMSGGPRFGGGLPGLPGKKK
jgi:signal recognition particle subunit SRP54